MCSLVTKGSFADRLIAAAGLAIWSLLAALIPQNAFAQSHQGIPPGIVMATKGQGIRYLTGGVGSEEREILESRRSDYNLKLVFAARSGSYLTDVRVIVKDDQSREVVNGRFEGPWLYLKLPAGKYQIIASFADQTTGTSDVELKESSHEMRILSWDVKAD